MEGNKGIVKRRRNVDFIEEGDTQYLLCSHCPYKTTKLRRLQMHISTKHTIFNLICDICDFKTIKKYKMNYHLKQTHGGSTYDCKRCSIKFGLKTLFKEHVKLNHRSSKKAFTCPKCGKLINSKSRLKVHIRVKHDNIFFNCHHCEAQFSRQYVLNDHIEDFHGLGDKNFDCPNCSEKFFTNNLLHRHLKKEHPEEYFIFCSQCPKKVSPSRKYRMVEHEKQVHQGVVFSCMLCTKTYKRQNRLQDHIKVEHDKIYFQCQYCEMKLKRGDALKGHIKTRHREIVDLKSFLDSYFPCTKCKASFSNERGLKSHIDEIHVVPVINHDNSEQFNETESNKIVRPDQETQTYGNIKIEECNTIELKPVDLNIDTILGSQLDSDLLKASCELLPNISSQFFGNSINVLKTEELQYRYIIDNVKTLEQIKTDEGTLDIPEEDNSSNRSVKEEEEILTNITTKFIRENIDLPIKSTKKVPKPSKIVIIKPKPSPLIKIERKDLQKMIKAIELSLKDDDLEEFRNIVRHNRGTNRFKSILSSFILKLKCKMTKKDNYVEVISID